MKPSMPPSRRKVSEVEIVDDSAGLWAYPAIFFALVAAGLGFPIPEEIPVVTAGGLCAKAASRPPTDPADWTAALALPGAEADPILAAAVAADWARRENAPYQRPHPLWWVMLPVCIIGVVTCDAFLYGVGRWRGAPFLERPWVQKYIVKPDKRAMIERHFQKYGVRTLLGVRLLPGIRAPVFIIAGAVRLPLHRFLLADGIYAVPVVTTLFTLAYWFTDSVVTVVQNLERQVGSAKQIIVIVGIAALAVWLLYEFWKRWKVTGDPNEVPLIGAKVIKPPAPPPDKQGSVLIAPVAEQQAEAQERQRKKKQPADRPRASMKTYVVAALAAAVACWAVYETVRRRRNI
jgi:membrane protein DedA with SNARE-associated domain